MNEKTIGDEADFGVSELEEMKTEEQTRTKKSNRSVSGTEIRMLVTARDSTQRLNEVETLRFGRGDESFTGTAVLVDPTKRFQRIEGFGGAFTESASVSLDKMSASLRAEAIRAYFDPETGHGYSLCRTHMNSCDFSVGNYACCDTDGDTALKSFHLGREKESLLPLIQEANRVAGRPVKLFISPWSPPAWMKTTGKMNHGGKLKPDYRQAWAQYYCRFIQELEREGVPVWGLTVQNEPEATQIWDSCIYTPSEECDFVRDYLGPTLEAEGYGNLKLMIWDHNRDRAVHRAKAIYDDPEAAKYVWGLGFHWYSQSCFDNIRLIHDAWPDKGLLFTEGCKEAGPGIGSWETGERYGESIISDLNRWTAGWVDWNLVLDEEGGPNHVGNFCSAPILCDTGNDQLLYQPSYYYIGHFSRAIRPGAERILCASTHNSLEVTAARNPDGSVAVVVMNRSESPLEFSLDYGGKAARVVSQRRSISTLIFQEAKEG